MVIYVRQTKNRNHVINIRNKYKRVHIVIVCKNRNGCFTKNVRVTKKESVSKNVSVTKNVRVLRKVRLRLLRFSKHVRVYKNVHYTKNVHVSKIELDYINEQLTKVVRVTKPYALQNRSRFKDFTRHLKSYALQKTYAFIKKYTLQKKYVQ